MRLSDFEADLISFQVDYPFAHWLWDRAGQIWQRLVDFYPGLAVAQATPGNIAANVGRIDLGVELRKSFIVLHRPTNDEIESFGRNCRVFFEAVATTLDVQQLDRVGCRSALGCTYKTLDEATAELMQLGLLAAPKGANFGLKEAKVNAGEYTLTQRGQSTGVTVRIKSEERKIELKPPASMHEVEAKEWKTPRIVLDADFYTCAPRRRVSLMLMLG